MYNGKGEIRWKSGNTYRGQFIDDEFVEGSMIYKGGSYLEGHFVKENLHGLGKFVFESGEYQIGEWENGKKQGEHKVYEKEGNQRWFATYKDNEVTKLVEIL